MTPFSTLAIASLLAVLGAAAPTAADGDVARAAAVVVAGRVAAVAAEWDGDTIYTYITIDVRDVVKGWIPERRITLKQLGGRVGDTALVIDGQAIFDRNEDVFLFLSIRPRDRTLMTTALGRGKWTIVSGAKANDRRARRLPAATTQVVLGAGEERSLAALVDAARSSPPAGYRDIVVDPREARTGSPAAALDATRFFRLPRVQSGAPAFGCPAAGFPRRT